MPTIPLLAEPVNPNGSHRVAAPGGYEGWHFDATSDDGRVHILAALHEAWAFDAAYLRRYAWYRTFPTRLRPPVPSDYPAVTFALCEAGRETIRFTARAHANADEVRIADDGRSVRVGGSHADRSFNESIRLHLRGMEGTRGAAATRTIASDLTFHPRIHANGELTLLDSPTAGLHRWVIVDPLCDVEGEVSIFDATGGPPRIVSFAGLGFHDHRYGTRPPAASLHGRMLLDGRAIAFARMGDEDAHLMHVAEGAMPELSRVSVSSDGAEMKIGPMHLSRPVVLESDRYETLRTYDAVVAGERGVALIRERRGLSRWASGRGGASGNGWLRRR
jgi:hypothetical protein